MSLFGSIMSKIFNRKPAAKATPTATQTRAPMPGATAQTQAPAQQQQQQQQQPVDVEAVLSAMAQEKGDTGLNWRTSIVDLLKLLDLDSSLTARKELGQELGVHAGADGSAEQNLALQKAVMRKLAENGGQVPASLRD